MLYTAARSLLFLLDPETAHGVTLSSLRLAHRLGLTALAGLPGRAFDGPPVETMGLRFPNPVGLAAGLDKNGECITAFAALGFGFVEVGTVTPRPQPGNPKPRLFRVPQARAIINRFGFNSVGVEQLVANVRRARYDGILGINIGKNFDTPIERAADDYVACLARVYPFASYIVVNISSPNTKDLRRLQQEDELGGLLTAVARERDRQRRATSRRVPLVVKIAPDLDDEAIAAIAELLVTYEIDGVAATNTTLSREGVEGLPHADEAGGLSGAPLTARSTAVLAKLSAALAGRLPIIGVGGIMSAGDARAKFEAGASLIQLYSGLIYRGPALVREIVRDLEAARTAQG